MHTFLKILLCLALPLAWGLAVEYVFHRIRKRRTRPDADNRAAGSAKP